MGRRSLYNVAAAVLLGAAAVLIGACDNTVDPFVASDDESFAIFGYLASQADTQFVRISPVIGASGFTYDDTLDAHVVLVNLSARTELHMQPASTPLDDGRRAYYYYTTVPPDTGAAYRLDVFRPGGDTTQAFTRMPGTDQIEVLDPETDANDMIVQRIRWLDVGNVRDIRINYHIRSRSTNTIVSLDYRSPQIHQQRMTVVDLQRDRASVIDRLPPNSGAVTLLGISVTAELLSPEWAFGATPERIFFGSVGEVQKHWSLPDSLVARLGYRVP